MPSIYPIQTIGWNFVKNKRQIFNFGGESFRRRVKKGVVRRGEDEEGSFH